MDPSDSSFWQTLVLVVLLVPSAIGIGISTYYAQKQHRSELLNKARKHMVDPGKAKAD